MKIKAWHLAIALIVILFGGIFASQLMGWWRTSGPRTPATVKGGQFAGTADPMDIRGSSYFTDIARSFSIPLEDLAQAYQITDAKARTFRCKDLESLDLGAPGQDIGTASVRTFAALYTGWSADEVVLADLPDSAVSVLLDKGSLDDSARAYLESLEK